MAILGLILLILGWLLGLQLLVWIGVLLLICGVVFLALAHSGRGRYWY